VKGGGGGGGWGGGGVRRAVREKRFTALRRERDAKLKFKKYYADADINQPLERLAATEGKWQTQKRNRHSHSRSSSHSHRHTSP